MTTAPYIRGGDPEAIGMPLPPYYVEVERKRWHHRRFYRWNLADGRIVGYSEWIEDKPL